MHPSIKPFLVIEPNTNLIWESNVSVLTTENYDHKFVCGLRGRGGGINESETTQYCNKHRNMVRWKLNDHINIYAGCDIVRETGHRLYGGNHF